VLGRTSCVWIGSEVWLWANVLFESSPLKRAASSLIRGSFVACATLGLSIASCQINAGDESGDSREGLQLFNAVEDRLGNYRIFRVVCACLQIICAGRRTKKGSADTRS
jgi:hypothetical protein